METDGRRSLAVDHKIHVTEMADEEQAVQFIMGVDTVAANDGDSEQVDPIQSRREERELLPCEHHVDQGYTSGPNLAKSAERGVELVGLVAVDCCQPNSGLWKMTSG